MFNIFIALLILLFPWTAVYAEDAKGSDIKYCEELAQESGEWRYPDRQAFYKALTVSHGLATDIGLLENNHRLKFEMSHTVAEAKRILTGVEPENTQYAKSKTPR